MTIASVINLVEILRGLPLLEPDQMAEVNQELSARHPAPKSLAGELLKRGWLTPYQVNQIFQGRGSQLVLGHYLLLERLGSGGMGEVFKARSLKLGRLVAIKVVRKEYLTHEGAVRRFHREIQAAAQLVHPNIVLAFDADQVGQAHFFVMEYVAGVDLNRLVRQHGPLDVGTACDSIRQAARGLQHAHERGMVHRDIKPHNLLQCKQDRRVKILDMGLARLLRVDESQESLSLTREGAVMGTPDYIAPEQAMNAHQADIRSDLYSLGCTFFFLLAGRPPFLGGSALEKLLKHQGEPPLDPRSLRPDVSPAVARVILRLMAKKPEDRYQAPAQLAAELDTILEGTSSPTPSPAPAATPVPPPPRDLAEASSVFGFGEDTQPSSEQLRRSLQPQLNWKRIGVISGSAVLALILLALLLTLRLRKKTPAAPSQDDTPVTLSFHTEEDARKAWETVQARLVTPGTRPEQMREELLVFARSYPGSGPAQAATMNLTSLPSPLDQLDRAGLDASEQLPGEPVEVVAVLGRHAGWRGFSPPRFWQASYSPNGKWLVCTSSSGEIRLMDPSSFEVQHTLKSRLPAYSFDIDSDTSRLVSVGAEVCLWDLGASPPRRFHVLAGVEGAYEARFSPDGKTLAVACNAREALIQLWDLSEAAPSRKGMLRGHQQRINSLAFSPDGRHLVSGSHDRMVCVWDLSLQEPKPRFLKGHGDWVYSVCWSPDGKWIASSGAHDWTVRLWSVPNNYQMKPPVRMSTAVNCLAFSPDSKVLAGGTWFGTVQLWNVARQGLVNRASILAHSRYVVGVAFSPDGKTIVSSGEEGLFRLWDVATGKQHRLPGTGHSLCARAVAFSPDASLLASTSDDKTILLWSFEDGKPHPRAPLRMSSPVLATTFSPDGTLLAAGDSQGQVKLWVVADGQEHAATTSQARRLHRLAFRPNGKELASGGGTQPVQTFTLAGSPSASYGLPGNVNQLAFSLSGRLLAVASANGKLQLWSTEPLALDTSLASKGQPITALAFSPDGKHLATGDTAGKIRLWDSKTHRESAPLSSPHQQEVVFLAYTPDGKQILSADKLGIIHLRPADGSSPVRALPLPLPIAAAALASDGRHLATANCDGSVYLLRLAPPPG